MGTSEKIKQQMSNWAKLLLVKSIEHAQHVMAALQEEKVKDSHSLKDKISPTALPLQINTNLLQISRLIEKFIQIGLFFPHNLLVFMICAIVCKFEELIHRIGLM